MFRFSLPGASQYGFDTCRHFAQREGFGYVVVRSQVETGHGVIFRIFGGNEDDGYLGCLLVLLQHARHFEAGNFSHHHVQQ